MRYANDDDGRRIEICEAVSTSRYYCPACNAPMIIKRGEIMTHHFAHKPGSLCDPYYSECKSPWHLEMQNMFPVETQECGVWNLDKSEVHIADVLIPCGDRKIVFEFQHSPISHEEFRIRTSFYLKMGYHIVWVFNFATIEKPKKIYYIDKNSSNPDIRNFVWPGRDYVALFEGYKMWNFLTDNRCNKDGVFNVLLYIDTAKGYQWPWLERGRETYRWSADIPPQREKIYVMPEFNEVDWIEDESDEENLKYFRGKCMTEGEYQIMVEYLSTMYEKHKSDF